MRRLFPALASLAGVAFLLAACTTMIFDPSLPPVARREPHVREVHGDRFVDDYFWLRQKTNPAVIAHLEAENAYTAAVMKPTEPLQHKLYAEMVGRIQETDLDVPYRLGHWLYYSRTEKGQQYRIHCRKPADGSGAEQVILDVNALAQGGKFMAVEEFEVSDDGNLLAYTTDNTGYRQYTLHVKDLRTGKTLSDAAPRVTSVAWAADNRTLLFSMEDDTTKRSDRIFRQQLGDAKPTQIFEEKDERFEAGVGRTRSGSYVTLQVSSHTTSEWRCLDAKNPTGEWMLVAAREAGHEYGLDHHDGEFFIWSNKPGRNFALYTAPVTDPRPANWKLILPHRADVMIESVMCFADHYVLVEREGGLPQFKIVRYRDGATHAIHFPEPTYSASPGVNAEYHTGQFRYGYSSLITPESVFDHDLEGATDNLLKRQPVLGGFDPTNYVSERVLAPALDGTRVPVSLVYRRGTPRDGSAPLLLNGYGSYGIPNDASFSSSRLSLLDRGFVFAIAHIRGGGEFGKPWHDAGKMAKKLNTFTDFIAAAEFLVNGRYTSRDRLIITGGSAGGLLMGATVNLRPNLFKAVVTYVPFVDVLNTMLDESLPLTVGEFEEWGNPAKAEEYPWMRAYCPYTNLAAKDYPAMLVKTSLNDSQVMYWEPAKYVARLRALKTDKNPLLLHVNMAAGHGGASGRYDHLEETAFDYAFMLTQVGIHE